MGAAVSIGLSLSDFLRLTPSEFYDIWNYNQERKEDEMYDRWNLMRYHACIVLQPNLKRGSQMTPEKLLPLGNLDRDHNKSNAPKVSKEEAHRRFEKRLQQLKDLEQTPNNKNNGK